MSQFDNVPATAHSIDDMNSRAMCAKAKFDEALLVMASQSKRGALAAQLVRAIFAANLALQRIKNVLGK